MKSNPFRFLNYLKVQIAVYFLGTSLLLIMILGSVLYYSISDIIMKNELENTTHAVEQSGHYVEVYIEKLKSLSTLITQNTDIQDFFATGSDSSRSRVMKLINTSLQTDSYLASIILVSNDGKIISNEKSLDMTVSNDMMKEAWYKSAINSHQMPILTSIRQQAFTMNKDTWVISISQEITDQNGKNLGVLLIDIRYLVLENYLKTLNLGKAGYAFIVNDQYDVVYHPDKSYFEESLKREKLKLISKMRDGYDPKIGMLTHHYAIAHTNWTLVGLSSLDDLSAIRRHIFETLILVGFILFGIVIGSGIFIADRITNPIRDLEIAMKTVEDGLSALTVNEQGCYEAKSLARHFNAMIIKIDQLMASISEKEKYLRTYEINALHSQINPHFLYNTLDTIVWMAEFNDSEKVIEVTKALAQFFRLSLNQGKEMMPLENELDHVRQYLFIQKQRYEDQLNYTIEADESLRGIEVPKFILQPIVENAIYHGIRESGHPGLIQIIVSSKEDFLEISIEDNGIGFDPRQSKSNKAKLGGVGIDNVNQRIQLYYGKSYGISVDSTLNLGTKVTIQLPLSIPY